MNTPELPSSHNQFAYSVSEISGALKRVVEDNFGQVRVRGEISGWKQAASGHGYLKLKDENAVLDAVCWKGGLARMKFKPQDGVEVICTGKLTTYGARSSYQLVIDSMEPAGVGALMAMLEQLKQKLTAEGLFDEKRKKSLPFLPQVIGVVTSPTGAVIRDILHRLSERFPCHVILWPVLVQGQGAAEQVASAIEGFNALDGTTVPKPDLIIVARGGGALEDLWTFNEEIVVRAAAESKIPLISAVGHETDTTLIDYASDKRAPTPTAAAEIALPVREEWIFAMEEKGKRLLLSIMRLMREWRDAVSGLARGLPHPGSLIETAMQKLDDKSERLAVALPATVARKEQNLAVAAAKLAPKSLLQNVARHLQEITHAASRMQRQMQHMVEKKEEKLAAVARLLESVNPLAILERGFVLVEDAGGKVVTRAHSLAKGEHSLVFHDGRRKVTAN